MPKQILRSETEGCQVYEWVRLKDNHLATSWRSEPSIDVRSYPRSVNKWSIQLRLRCAHVGQIGWLVDIETPTWEGRRISHIFPRMWNLRSEQTPKPDTYSPIVIWSWISNAVVYERFSLVFLLVRMIITFLVEVKLRVTYKILRSILFFYLKFIKFQHSTCLLCLGRKARNEDNHCLSF